METRYDVAASNLFRGLTATECDPFVALALERTVGKGDYLFRLGEKAESLFIVLSGVVQLTMPLAMKSGDREVVVEEAHPGDTVAWSALIEPYHCTMSARAGTDVDLLVFPPRALEAALAAHSDAGLRVVTNLAKVIARRLQVTHAMWTRELQRVVIETFG